MIAGPPCSSFVFLNSHTSGRRKNRPLGFASIRPYVRNANRKLDWNMISRDWILDEYYVCFFRQVCWPMQNYLQLLRITTRLVILWMLATVRCCWTLTEQPLSSCMGFFPYIVFFQRVINNLIPWNRVTLFKPQLLFLNLLLLIKLTYQWNPVNYAYNSIRLCAPRRQATWGHMAPLRWSQLRFLELCRELRISFRDNRLADLKPVYMYYMHMHACMHYSVL